MKFLGYSNFSIRWLAFVIANTTTALAGALYAVYLGFVSPEITSPARAADPVVVTILGGVGTLYGPIVGAIAYTGMKDLISGFIGNWELFIGFVLVFIMLAGEKGIWGTLEPLLKKALFPKRAAPDRSGRGDERQMMDTQLLISGVIFGLSIGSIFFLMAIGLSLCFGLMRIISLDQLLYYSVGAYITYTISVATGNMWLGVLGGMAAAGLVSFGVERFVFLRIYERDITFTMITSFGILIGGVGVIKYIWGLVPRPVPVPIEAQVNILGTEIPVYRLIVIAIAVLVYVGIWLFLNRTIIGKAIRAGIEDVEHVEGLGINVYRLFTITFIIAGTLVRAGRGTARAADHGGSADGARGAGLRLHGRDHRRSGQHQRNPGLRLHRRAGRFARLPHLRPAGANGAVCHHAADSPDQADRSLRQQAVETLKARKDRTENRRHRTGHFGGAAKLICYD